MAKAVSLQQPIESQILAILKEAKAEVHTEQMAERLGIARHTAAKYLEILKAKGRVSCRKVGNAKLWQPTVASLTLRPLGPEDLPALLEIQKQIQPAQDATAHTVFAQTMEYHIKSGDASLRLGAELQGQLVGFIVGEVRAWEFGIGEQTGWIKALAVAPEYQRRGIGQRLGEALLHQFRQRGIRRVRTLVDSYSGELIAYFRSVGFQILNMVPLEKVLTETAAQVRASNGYHKETSHNDQGD